MIIVVIVIIIIIIIVIITISIIVIIMITQWASVACTPATDTFSWVLEISTRTSSCR